MNQSAPHDNSPVAASLRPLLLLLGLAAAVAAGVGIALWSQTPNYSLLFGDLSDSDTAQLTQALNQAGIKYKLDGGAVLVPADQVNQVRLDMVGKGLTGASDLSLHREGSRASASASSWRTRATSTRSETELARTISSIKRRGRRARAPGGAAAVGLRARPSSGQRFGDSCSCAAAQRLSRETHRCHRQPGGLQPFPNWMRPNRVGGRQQWPAAVRARQG